MQQSPRRTAARSEVFLAAVSALMTGALDNQSAGPPTSKSLPNLSGRAVASKRDRRGSCRQLVAEGGRRLPAGSARGRPRRRTRPHASRFARPTRRASPFDPEDPNMTNDRNSLAQAGPVRGWERAALGLRYVL